MHRAKTRLYSKTLKIEKGGGVHDTPTFYGVAALAILYDEVRWLLRDTDKVYVLVLYLYLRSELICL